MLWLVELYMYNQPQHYKPHTPERDLDFCLPCRYFAGVHLCLPSSRPCHLTMSEPLPLPRGEITYPTARAKEVNILKRLQYPVEEAKFFHTTLTTSAIGSKLSLHIT